MTAQRAEGKNRKPEPKTHQKRQSTETNANSGGMAGLQQSVGNRAVQRLITQRKGRAVDPESGQVNETIQTSIDRKRGHGQTLDEATQQSMGSALDQDFGQVQVHTDAESHQLNERLQARAFTTGPDIFFGQGEYNPNTSAGQELLAHELTHVVQQSEGRVDLGGQGMQVNDPDDGYEQEADSVARQVVGAGRTGNETGRAEAVQRSDLREEDVLEKPLQREDSLEEDILEKPVQRDDALEEDLLEKPIQREEGLDEEALLEKPVQREDALEEDILEKPVQRDEAVEEELLQKPVQRDDFGEALDLG